MPITIRPYAQFKGFAVDPGDISLGEAESKTLPVTSPAGQLLQAKFTRKRVTIVLKGINFDEAKSFVDAAASAGANLFTGNPPKEEISILGQTIEQAVLVGATMTQPIQFGTNGVQIVESTELIYESQVFV